MGTNVTCDVSTTDETIVTTKKDVSKTNENSVSNKEGSLNGAKTTSTLVNYEEVRRLQMVKLQTCMLEMGLVQAIEEL
jgi:hypothetical protein